MNGCDFFDDHSLTGSLPRWATITQVSTFLEVPRNAVRSAVRRAVANSEPWVKKETSQEGKPVYLIDTEHETYQTHEQRWNQNNILHGGTFPVSGAHWSHAGQALFTHRSSGQGAIPSVVAFPFAHAPRSEHDDSESGLDRWPRLRQWLARKGILIFKNILDEEEQIHPWRWCWDELEGEGCQDVEEAMVMALQNRLQTYEEALMHLDPTFFGAPLPEEPPQRFSFFSRKKEAPPF